MQPITRGEILPLSDYEQIRPHFRARIIAEKRLRRLELPPHLSVVFENRDTVLYQIQEMLRTERITSEPAIRHEIDTYNDLVPGPAQLSFTLFVEIPERALRERMLVELEGLERTVYLDVNDARLAAHGDFAGVLPGRTTAVHYLKFTLPEAAAAALRGGTAALALGIDHPRHPARAVLPAATVAALAADLA